jgi:hypothetical protein
MHLSSWLFPKSGKVALPPQTYGRVLKVTAPRKDELGHLKARPPKRGWKAVADDPRIHVFCGV